MQRNKRHVTIIATLLSILIISSILAGAQVNQDTTALPADGKIYVNANNGKNNNNGAQHSPLQTLSEAAKRINSAKGAGAITIYLSKGVYGLAETADFNPVNWEFTKDNRLTIRAEVLPDDRDWNPADMPVLISTMPFTVEKNDKNEITGAQNFGILIQNSHVTIQGLRILGEPVHENPSTGILIRNYPIVWEGKDLEDLHVTQCLFIGDKYAMPNHLGV